MKSRVSAVASGLKATSIFFLAVCAIGILAARAGAVESKPAVSAINAKVSGGYADLSADKTWFGDGSVTIPVGHSFGVALDGIGGDYSADAMWGMGGTLFWRNPDQGLLGIIGSETQIGSYESYRGGATGELYLGPVSLSADAGYQNGRSIKGGLFSQLGLNWYPMDNLSLGTGCAYSGRDTAGLVNVEYMPGLKVLPGVAFFADARWGESNYHSFLTGVTYYFGPGNKSLKARHREDDPQNQALKGLFLASQGGLTNAPAPVTTQPPPD
ncbi:MAG: hypothetical protein WCG78_00030 [Candidatus Omnitrophota bacterium]